jgi:polyisoprenoid-binding protein YceI
MLALATIANAKEQAMTTATTVEIPAGTWSLDPVHSSASFEVEHNGFALFRTSFKEFDATFTSGNGWQLEGAVRVESIDVDQPDFRAHLLSPEFFDSARHPTIEFTSSDLEADGDDLTLRGELTIAGNSRPIEATGAIRGPIDDPMGNERVSLSLRATVNRHDYGIGWNMDLPNGKKVLGDDVTLVVELELVKG